MAKGMERGWDPGREKKPKHDNGGVLLDKDGNILEVKKRIMPCGVEVPDTEQAEYEHRASCAKCTTLW